MKRLLHLLALAVLAALPAHAQHSGSFHGGGSYGGYHGGGSYVGYHGYSGSCYSGHSYCGGYNGYHGYYGGYVALPSYSYSSYGYAPAYSYPEVYTPTADDAAYYPSAYAPAPPQPANPATAPEVAPGTAPADTTAPASLPTGKLDDSGYIHSPFTTTTFKVDHIADGQIFHDPVTGQAFTIATKKAATPPVVTPVPTTSMPTGKVDQFGYIHSPYSTFTFKVQSGNTTQIFRDPLTGQTFAVRPKLASQPVASAQVVD